MSIVDRPSRLRAVAWDGEPLGRVREIRRFRGSGEAWAIIRTSWFHPCRAAPMRGAQHEHGVLRLRVTATRVRCAPSLSGPYQEPTARRHYRA